MPQYTYSFLFHRKREMSIDAFRTILDALPLEYRIARSNRFAYHVEITCCADTPDAYITGVTQLLGNALGNHAFVLQECRWSFDDIAQYTGWTKRQLQHRITSGEFPMDHFRMGYWPRLDVLTYLQTLESFTEHIPLDVVALDCAIRAYLLKTLQLDEPEM